MLYPRSISIAQNQRMLSLVLSAIMSVVWVIALAIPISAEAQTDSQIQWRVGKQLDRYTNAGFSGLMSEAPIGTRLKKFAYSFLTVF